jgi:hypothetical protein
VIRRLNESSRSGFAVAVYGTISLAVVVVAWDAEGQVWDLVFVVIGYTLAIWLAHAFATVVSGGHGATWRAALSHEKPVTLAAVPVVLLTVIGGLFGWSLDLVEGLALISLAVLLAVLQIVLLKSMPSDNRRVGSTVFLDMVAFFLIVLLLLAVH